MRYIRFENCSSKSRKTLRSWCIYQKTQAGKARVLRRLGRDDIWSDKKQDLTCLYPTVHNARKTHCKIYSVIFGTKFSNLLFLYTCKTTMLNPMEIVFFKIRPLLEMIRVNCKKTEDEEAYWIDEMILFKGTKAGNLRQYMPKKPRNRASKCLCLQ